MTRVERAPTDAELDFFGLSELLKMERGQRVAYPVAPKEPRRAKLIRFTSLFQCGSAHRHELEDHRSRRPNGVRAPISPLRHFSARGLLLTKCEQFQQHENLLSLLAELHILPDLPGFIFLGGNKPRGLLRNIL